MGFDLLLFDGALGDGQLMAEQQVFGNEAYAAGEEDWRNLSSLHNRAMVGLPFG